MTNTGPDAIAPTTFSAWPPLPGEMPGRNPGQWATCHPTRLAVVPDRYPFGSTAPRYCDECTADLEAECERCECTGTITVVIDDGEGGYDGSAPCPDCHPERYR